MKTISLFNLQIEVLGSRHLLETNKNFEKVHFQKKENIQKQKINNKKKVHLEKQKIKKKFGKTEN